MRDRHQLPQTNDFLDEIEKEDKPSTPQRKSLILSDDAGSPKKQTGKKLTQGQKLLLSFLIFLLVLIFGFFIMLITGTMVLP